MAPKTETIKKIRKKEEIKKDYEKRKIKDNKKETKRIIKNLKLI